MVIGFKKQFIEPIMQGIKVHTIREDTHGRWKPGMIMHMATGVRTKQYKQFALKQCESVQDIEVKYRYKGKVKRGVTVSIDGLEITSKVFFELCANDGFKNGVDFFIWFGNDFKGKIIHWTAIRY